MIKKRGFVLLSILLSSLTLSSCFMVPVEEDELAPPLFAPPKVSYSTVQVQRGDLISEVVVSATFTPFQQDTVVFRQRGRLLKMVASYNQVVKSGDLLAELDPGDLEYQIRQKNLQLKRAVTLKTAAIHAAETDQMDLEAAQLDLARLEKELLALKGYGTGKQIEDLQYQITAKTIQVRKQELLVQDRKAVTLAEYDLQAISMELEYLKKQLGETKLLSPVDGIIDYIADVQPGEMIDAYSKMFGITQAEDLILEYKGSDSEQFVMDQAVDMTIGASSTKYEGVVVQTPGSVPFEEREKYKDTIRFVIKDPPTVNAGDYAKVSMIKDMRYNTLFLPSNVIELLDGKPFVYVLKDGIRLEQFIEIGLKTTMQTEVLAGLTDGDIIISD